MTIDGRKPTYKQLHDASTLLVEALDRMYGNVWLSENVRGAASRLAHLVRSGDVRWRDPADETKRPKAA